MDQQMAITLHLTPAEARALAELCERIGMEPGALQDWLQRRWALSATDKEAHAMNNAIYKLAGALAVAGVKHR